MDHTKALGDLVAEVPARAATLDRLGLDYCCGGHERFEDACRFAGLDPAAVEAQLERIPRSDDPHICTGMAPQELIAHLVGIHHAYLHEELPALNALARKVLEVHGARHPELTQVHEIITLLADDLEPHMMKEERVLFPAIQRLTSGPADFPFGSISNPIRMMSSEHERAGALLVRLRDATGNYEIPTDACASYRSLYERLASFDHDTHLHIFEENHLLFPMADALEVDCEQ